MNKQLVNILNGEAYTTSRKIAEKFGKQHKHVLKDIEKLIDKLGGQDCGRQMFIETTYNNRGKEYKEYLVSQDGLTLYLFNIQGYVEEKMEYINEFNRMKQLIIDLQLGKPEAIMSLLTWKNSNMETTIRTYINGNNVLSVLPAIAESCKKQILDGETKLEVLATAIRTARAMRDEEENLAYRDLYNQAIEKASAMKEKILIGRMGGISSSNKTLEAKCKRLQDQAYEDDDFYDFINAVVDDKALQVYNSSMQMYVGYIVQQTGLQYRSVYKSIYSNVTDRYTDLYLPAAKTVKEAGYKSLSEYFYVTNGMPVLNQFAHVAEQWAKRLGFGKQEEE